MMQRMRYYLSEGIERTNAFLTKHRLIFGGLLALALAGMLALYNVSSGPLHNLNDIGGWANRALFIAMTAAVHAAMLLFCTAVSRCCFARIALRQGILTAGLYILLLAINQKAYVYLHAIQPVVRAMDEGGLAAAAAMETNLSAPALALLYLITRGPVYDMYLLKLFAIAGMLLIGVLMMHAAERGGLGIRTEALLALCMILPQGFMNAGCSGMLEIGALALLGVSLTLAFGMDRPRTLAAALFWGAAFALSGAALYALPVYAYWAAKGRMEKRHLGFAVLLAALLCVPAVIGGMPVSDAALSLFRVNLGLPAYASGAPGLMNLIPHAAVTEMAQYAPVLSHFEALDLATHAQEYYTQAHFEALCRGFALVSAAAYMGVCALAVRAKEKSLLHRVMILTLGALIACPNASSAVWLAADVLCLYAILAQPDLRLPSCMVLFATLCSSAYPMTQETLLPMIYAFALCFGALCMLLDVIPGGKKELV